MSAPWDTKMRKMSMCPASAAKCTQRSPKREKKTITTFIKKFAKHGKTKTHAIRSTVRHLSFIYEWNTIPSKKLGDLPLLLLFSKLRFKIPKTTTRKLWLRQQQQQRMNVVGRREREREREGGKAERFLPYGDNVHTHTCVCVCAWVCTGVRWKTQEIPTIKQQQ